MNECNTHLLALTSYMHGICMQLSARVQFVDIGVQLPKLPAVNIMIQCTQLRGCVVIWDSFFALFRIGSGRGRSGRVVRIFSNSHGSGIGRIGSDRTERGRVEKGPVRVESGQPSPTRPDLTRELGPGPEQSSLFLEICSPGFPLFFKDNCSAVNPLSTAFPYVGTKYSNCKFFVPKTGLGS